MKKRLFNFFIFFSGLWFLHFFYAESRRKYISGIISDFAGVFYIQHKGNAFKAGYFNGNFGTSTQQIICTPPTVQGYLCCVRNYSE